MNPLISDSLNLRYMEVILSQTLRKLGIIDVQTYT